MREPQPDRKPTTECRRTRICLEAAGTVAQFRFLFHHDVRTPASPLSTHTTAKQEKKFGEEKSSPSSRNAETGVTAARRGWQGELV